MTDNHPGFVPEEPEMQAAGTPPDRTAQSLVNANVATRIDAALALAMVSDGSTGYANAVNAADVTQGR